MQRGGVNARPEEEQDYFPQQPELTQPVLTTEPQARQTWAEHGTGGVQQWHITWNHRAAGFSISTRSGPMSTNQPHIQQRGRIMLSRHSGAKYICGMHNSIGKDKHKLKEAYSNRQGSLELGKNKAYMPCLTTGSRIILNLFSTGTSVVACHMEDGHMLKTLPGDTGSWSVSTAPKNWRRTTGEFTLLSLSRHCFSCWAFPAAAARHRSPAPHLLKGGWPQQCSQQTVLAPHDPRPHALPTPTHTPHILPPCLALPTSHIPLLLRAPPHPSRPIFLQSPQRPFPHPGPAGLPTQPLAATPAAPALPPYAPHSPSLSCPS